MANSVVITGEAIVVGDTSELPDDLVDRFKTTGLTHLTAVSGANLVLLLDSSGSMKGQMEKTITAAQAFINGLPDNAVIQLVDFDTSQTIVEGTTKAAALAGLKNVKAKKI